MYKILIVEDEPWISTLIRSILEEGISSASVIGEAVNGRQALSMIAELQPDIVLTDINLPILSGLQVIGQARDSGFSGKFVVISGYNDFSYVQQALRFGVDDYLLKPIDDEELCKLITKLTKELDNNAVASLRASKNDAIIKSQFLNRLVLKKYLPLAVCNEFYTLHFTAETFCCVVAKFNLTGSFPVSEIFAQGKRLEQVIRSALLPLCTEVFSVQRGSYFIAIFSYPDKEIPIVQKQLEQQLQRFLQHQPGPFLQTTIGVSSSYEDFMRLQDACRQTLWAVSAQSSMENQIFYALDTYSTPLNEPRLVNNQNIDALTKALYECSEAPAQAWMQQHLTAIINRYQIMDEEVFLLLPVAALLLRTFFKTVSRLFPQVPVQLENYLNQIESCVTVEDLQAYLADTVQRVKADIQKQRNTADYTIDRITEYISAHLSDSVSLEDVAGAVYLTPGYLSEYFKSKMDTNFKDYIFRLRMERAKYLLGKNIRIQDISSQCGYNDVKYFCKVFKKYYGVAPTEYRRIFG